MNRKRLLALLRATCAYQGAETLESVKAFIAEGVNLVDEAGKPIDVDAAWAKTAEKKTVIFTVSATAGEEVKYAGPGAGGEDNSNTDPDQGAPTDDGDPGDETDNKPEPKRSRLAPVHKAAASLQGVKARHFAAIAARKAYQASIARGVTAGPNSAKFADADHAEHFGAMLRLAALDRVPYPEKERDLEIVNGSKMSYRFGSELIQKAGVEYNHTMGGYLVPEEYRAQLIWLTEQYGVARRLANVVPMSRDTCNVPRQTGIVTMSHATEAATQSEQDESGDTVALVARKVMALRRVSSELMMDSAISIADIAAKNFAEAQAIREDSDYILGDGSGTYGHQVGLQAALPGAGVASVGAYVSAGSTPNGGATNGAQTTWAAITENTLFSVQGIVENVKARNLKWLCSRQFAVQCLQRLAKASGGVTYTEATFGPNGNVFGSEGGGPDFYFNGFPGYWAQVAPTASAVSTKSAYFGDFLSATMLGDRKELAVAVSDQRYFDSDSIGIRGVARICTNIHGDGRGSTYGPIACLMTSAT